MKRFYTLFGAAALLLSGVAAARSEEGCCCHCGDCCPTKKICRLVCEQKEIKKVVWGCKCDAVCLPPPSRKCGECSECVHCDGQGCDCCSHGACGAITKQHWEPDGCAKIRDIKKLQKFEIKVKVPTYKWVVEDVCCDCCDRGCCADGAPPAAHAGAVDISPSESAPPPMPPSARVHYPSARRTSANAR